jgi:hypothetical protein
MRWKGAAEFALDTAAARLRLETSGRMSCKRCGLEVDATKTIWEGHPNSGRCKKAPDGSE